MEMLYRNNNLRKYIIGAVSAIIVVAILMFPATAMFSLYGQQDEIEVSNDGLKMSAVSDNEITENVKDKNEAEAQIEEIEQTTAQVDTTSQNVEEIVATEIECQETVAQTEQSVVMSPKLVKAFKADGSSNVHYEDEYAYCITVFDKKNDSERVKRSNVLSGELKRVYELDGEYSTFNGTLILFFDARQTGRQSEFKVYGDGKLLHTGSVMTGGSVSEDFSIDVSGVDELTVEFKGSSSRKYYKYEFAGLSDCTFQK